MAAAARSSWWNSPPRWLGADAPVPGDRKPGWRAYGWAIGCVVVGTLINGLLFGRLNETNLVLVYLVGIIPVSMRGHRGAAIFASVLAVAAFDYFFTRPYYTLYVYDVNYYLTFLAMGVVALVTSTLTASLAAKIAALKLSDSELARRAEALARANADLQRLDRLKANLISNASHELRTPLAAIAGFIEFLEEPMSGDLNAEQREYVTQIHQGARRLEGLVDDLMEFARLDAGTFQLDYQEADLRDLVAVLVETMRPHADQAGVHLEATLPDQATPVDLDPTRIEQVLRNLVENAIKFTPAGGRVTVSLSAEAEAVKLVVADTGIGIAAEQLPLVFQKFYQAQSSTTRTFGGIGLGLALSKALVEAHGGRIDAASAQGRGSTFTVTLPVHKPPDAR